MHSCDKPREFHHTCGFRNFAYVLAIFILTILAIPLFGQIILTILAAFTLTILVIFIFDLFVLAIFTSYLRIYIFGYAILAT